MFLKPSWAFECIRTQALPVFEMHAHPFVSWEKLYSLDNSLLPQELPLKDSRDQMVLVGERKKDSKVHDLTSSPPKPSDRKGKRAFRPYDGDKDSQEREASVPLFSPMKVREDTLSLFSEIYSLDLPV
jgi:hypothetical protein